MCGRFTQLYTWRELHALLALTTQPNFELVSRYNVAPGQDILVVRAGSKGGVEVVMMRWGYVSVPASSKPLINARCETVRTKGAFAESFRERRCIIPASGFYEWQTIPGERRKQPYYITRSDGLPLLLAAVWTPARADTPETVAILTMPANEVVRSIHNRMPVILAPDEARRWIAGDATPDELTALLKQRPAGTLTAHPVGRLVNSVDNDGVELIAPIDAAATRRSTGYLWTPHGDQR